MKGVKYYYDEEGEPIAVLIDLKKNPAVWEDFRDRMILDIRCSAPRESADEVKAKLFRKRENGAKKEHVHNGSGAICASAIFHEAPMKGIKYFYDRIGEPIAVLIDLKKNPEVWEDFHDLKTLEERRNEPTRSLEEVEKRLRKLGKLK